MPPRLGEIRLDTLDDLVNMVAREINDEISKLIARVKDMEIRVTTAFDKFRDQFPAESADLGAGLEFAGDAESGIEMSAGSAAADCKSRKSHGSVLRS